MYCIPQRFALYIKVQVNYSVTYKNRDTRRSRVTDELEHVVRMVIYHPGIGSQGRLIS